MTHVTEIHSNLLCGKPFARPWDHSGKEETVTTVLRKINLYFQVGGTDDKLKKKWNNYRSWAVYRGNHKLRLAGWGKSLVRAVRQRNPFWGGYVRHETQISRRWDKRPEVEISVAYCGTERQCPASIEILPKHLQNIRPPKRPCVSSSGSLQPVR